MKLLVTGAAGFIGAGVAMQALARGDEVVGIDNLNDYYDVSLKQARLERLTRWPNFAFEWADVADRDAVAALYQRVKPQRVVHLAAQAGVRYSIENPMAYVDANLVGFATMLEGARHHQVEHLVYASSSSVYGANTKLPFAEDDNVDHPVSLYAATKKANELMAHSYSHLYGIPTTGLRFFTVYGPWGRPDMALFTFTQRILAGQAIDVFNYGKHHRDFTYIDDIVEGVMRVVDRAPVGTPEHAAPWRVYNIGNSRSIELAHYISTLERCLGRDAHKHYLPMQPGDVADTDADVSALEREFGYKPSTSVEQGIQRFVDWYCGYYGVAL